MYKVGDRVKVVAAYSEGVEGVADTSGMYIDIIGKVYTITGNTSNNSEYPYTLDKTHSNWADIELEKVNIKNIVGGKLL